VAISLIRAQTEKHHQPPVVVGPFELGRPVPGPPSDPAFPEARDSRRIAPLERERGSRSHRDFPTISGTSLPCLETTLRQTRKPRLRLGNASLARWRTRRAVRRAAMDALPGAVANDTSFSRALDRRGSSLHGQLAGWANPRKPERKMSAPLTLAFRGRRLKGLYRVALSVPPGRRAAAGRRLWNDPVAGAAILCLASHVSDERTTSSLKAIAGLFPCPLCEGRKLLTDSRRHGSPRTSTVAGRSGYRIDS